jgi:hypothetical protein
MAARRQRWGDTLDDDEVSGTVTGILPPTQVTQQGNVKTVVEYYRNDKGEIIKKTTRSKVVNVEKKVYKVGCAVSRPSDMRNGKSNTVLKLSGRRICTTPISCRWPRSAGSGLGLEQQQGKAHQTVLQCRYV